mmetsp:Transcript_24472/g.58030  ORF Transcript_24472/g.58030 Transcript_24472/m.58030 type:complete len:364 (+) Transcript_24472:163-1254(+)
MKVWPWGLLKGTFTLTAFVSSPSPSPSLSPSSLSLSSLQLLQPRHQTPLFYQSSDNSDNNSNFNSRNRNMTAPEEKTNDNIDVDVTADVTAPVPPPPPNAAASTVTDDTEDSPTKSLQSILPPLQEGCRRIYLLRHGETDWNTLGKIQGGGYDIPLNDNGRLQATKAAVELDGIPLDVIASSSLSRAKETADILYSRHSSSSNGGDNNDDHNGGVPIRRVVDAGFNEMSFGEWEGFASRDESVDGSEIERFKDTSRHVKADPSFPFPGGGESTKQVEERSVKALYDVLNNPENSHQRHIAIVSHGRTNKVLIAAVGLGDVQRFKEVKQANVAINVMDIDDTTGIWTVHVMNYHNHVQGHVIVR